MANLSCFITDFLQSTEEEEKNIPHGVKRPLEPAVPAEQERADRKSARERRRRAEVGEKFEELTSALAQAEAALPHVLTRPRSDAEGSRARPPAPAPRPRAAAETEVAPAPARRSSSCNAPSTPSRPS